MSKNFLENRRVHCENGSFLVATLVIILFLTAIGLSIAQLTVNQYQHTRRSMFEQNAVLVAEAGVEQSVRKLNVDDNFAGFAAPQEFITSNNVQGAGTFTTTITTNSDSKSKTIESIGVIYRPGGSSPYITRKIRVTAVGTSSSGYSVYSGPGGLILSGSASIINSAVYVNGFIKMTGASRIGTSDHPLDIDVANKQCPAGGGPTYPALCTDGTQPISMDYSTKIYGNVCATGQTDVGPNNNITGGNGGTGLKLGCVAPEVSTPTYDRQSHISAVTTTKTSNDNAINCSRWQSGVGFKRTWPANLKITGNVNVATSCDLTITGNVYITGNLTIGGAARITVDDSVGATRPVVIVDGTISVGGSSSMIANDSGTGLQFISFKSTAACSPACTSVTGTDLYNSQRTQTVSVGGAANVPGMIFDSYWGKISIGGSGTIGTAIGQTVDLSGAGTVTFGTILSSGQRTWTIRSYQHVYD